MPTIPGTYEEKISFSKYSALGNHFLVTAATGFDAQWDVKKICHENGVDGLLLGKKTKTNRYALRIFNADGSEAEMSGNGVRIFAAYLVKSGSIRLQEPIFIGTDRGNVACTVHGARGEIYDVSANLKILAHDATPACDPSLGISAIGYHVNVGNPHFVIPVRDLGLAVDSFMESHNHPPEKTNVQFLNVIDEKNIALRCWERGVGETDSCGSGSAAVAFISHHALGCHASVEVRMRGGTLRASVTGTMVAIRGHVCLVS
jgi:diaminopimelate epimerase